VATTWTQLQAEATELLGRGQARAAAERLIEAIELAPKETQLYQQLVRVALLAGSPGTAVQAAKELRALDDSSESAWLHAVALLADNHPTEARGVLEKALAAHPDDARLHLHLGQVLLETGHREEARTHVEQAVTSVDPTVRADANALLAKLKG